MLEYVIVDAGCCAFRKKGESACPYCEKASEFSALTGLSVKIQQLLHSFGD